MPNPKKTAAQSDTKASLTMLRESFVEVTSCLSYRGQGNYKRQDICTAYNSFRTQASVLSVKYQAFAKNIACYWQKYTINYDKYCMVFLCLCNNNQLYCYSQWLLTVLLLSMTTNHCTVTLNDY